MTIAWLVATALAALVIGGMVFRGFPGLHPDSSAYVVPAIAESGGDGYVSPVYAPWFYVEPRGSFVFDFHGPLQVIVLARLFGCRTPMDAVHALGALSALGVVVFGVTKLVRSGAAATIGSFARDLASLAIVCQVVLYLGGRPELLAMPLVEIAILVALRTNDPRRAFVGLGGIAGLVLLAAPQTGVLFVLLLVAFAAWTSAGLQLVRNVALAGTASLATLFAVVTLFHPYSLLHLARKTLALSGLGSDASWSSKIVSYWFGHSAVPLLGFSFVCAALVAVHFLVREHRSCRTPLVAWVALALAAFVVVRHSVLVSATHYNVLAFCGVALFALEGRAKSPRPAGSPRARRLLGVARDLSLAGAALPFVVTLAGYVWYEREGVTLAEARAQVAAIEVRDGERIGFDQWGCPSLWVLANRSETMLTFASWQFRRHEQDLGIRYAILLWPADADVDPDVLSEFDLAPPGHAPAPRYLRWVVGARARPDYAVAVCHRR